MASKAYNYSGASLERARGMNTHYFTPDVFQACFKLPRVLCMIFERIEFINITYASII